MRTTAAVRDFSPQPVTRDVLWEILDDARFAPNGGNRQPWRVIVVEDPERRRALRDTYLASWTEYLALSSAGLVPFAVTNDPDDEQRIIAAARAGGGPKPGRFA